MLPIAQWRGSGNCCSWLGAKVETHTKIGPMHQRARRLCRKTLQCNRRAEFHVVMVSGFIRVTRDTVLIGHLLAVQTDPTCSSHKISVLKHHPVFFPTACTNSNSLEPVRWLSYFHKNMNSNSHTYATFSHNNLRSRRVFKVHLKVPYRTAQFNSKCSHLFCVYVCM